MLCNEVFEQFAREAPVSVMVRATLENALNPLALDQLFEATAQRQYTRTLLFSSIVDLMSTVVCRIRPSINAAYQALLRSRRQQLHGKIAEVLQERFTGTVPEVVAVPSPQSTSTTQA